MVLSYFGNTATPWHGNVEFSGLNDLNMTILDHGSMPAIPGVVVHQDDSLKAALQAIEDSKMGACFVVDRNMKLIGLITDGDARRELLENTALDTPISKLSIGINRQPVVAKAGLSLGKYKEIMTSNGIRQLPVIQADGVLVDIITSNEPSIGQRHRNRVILMAGGLGSRLLPLTENCPKPMLSIGGKPILERTIEQLRRHGFHDFHISVNYLGHQIEDYFGDGSDFDVKISYIRETKRLGTGGALSLMNDIPDEPVLVLNADLLTDLDFYGVVRHHHKNEFEATMVVRSYPIKVPYGVVTSEEGNFSELLEKPTQTFDINAGIYVLSPEALNLVPKDAFFDLPQLFPVLKKAERNCGIYHFDGNWLDIGSPEDYRLANQKTGS